MSQVEDGSQDAPSSTEAKALEVAGLEMRFGGVLALSGVAFSVEAGEICAVIGPNGAGKTTLFNCVSRIAVPSKCDELTSFGADLLGLHAHDMPKVGIMRTLQTPATFGSMTVLENVLLGAHSVYRGSFSRAALGMRSLRRQERQLRAQAMELLEEVGLQDHAEQECGSLAYGTLKRIELVRALMARPRLVLLDEPAAGLNGAEVAELSEWIRRTSETFDLTVLLVEHHMGMVMSLSDHVVVLNFGQKIADGTVDEVRGDRAVITAYLGADE